MRKLFIPLFVVIFLSTFFSVASCGPSAEERARLDSIRIADSLQRVDSIQLADSLNAVKEAEAQLENNHKKVDEVAATTKADFILKVYEHNKVVYANEGDLGEKKYITIHDVTTGAKETMALKGSEDSGWIEGINPGKDPSQVVVKIHLGGNVSFYKYYTVDIVSQKLIKVVE